MLNLFPMNFKLKRNSFFPKLIIRIGGRVRGTEGLAINQIYELVKSARLFNGRPLNQPLVFRPQYDEEFVVSIQIKFKSRRLMNEFVKYILANPTTRGS